MSPFIPVNCGAISPELFESEIFGHEPGAFTGANPSGYRGKVSAAETGTLFLDEIGEMSEANQVKLLRILDGKKFYRVGGNTEFTVKARIVCATNKNLEREVQEGRFRLDLFYRINTAVLYIPPLRERREEILPLATRLARRAAAKRGHNFGRFSPGAEKLLLNHQWPGNVRQLKNLMDRLALFGPWEVVRASDIPFSGQAEVRRDPATSSQASKPVLGLDEFSMPEENLNLEGLTKEIIIRAYEKHNRNISKTARYLGLTRRVLQTRLKNLGDL